MIGVNFQPGQSGQQTASGGQKPANTGVQEAIKVLSLRLPKVVGARGIAPQALLESQGGGGRVDGVVSKIMGEMFPTGAPPAAPGVPGAPTVSGSVSPTTPLASFMPPQAFAPDVARAPRISPVDEPGMGSPRATPAPIPVPGGPSQGGQIDVNPAARPSDGTKDVIPAAPQADPLADFLEFLRRNQQPVYEPAPPQETPSI